MNDSLIYISITLTAMAFIVGVNEWNKRKDSIHKRLLGKQHAQLKELRERCWIKDQRIALHKKDNEALRRVLNMRTGGTNELTLVYDAEKSINNMMVDK